MTLLLDETKIASSWCIRSCMRFFLSDSDIQDNSIMEAHMKVCSREELLVAISNGTEFGLSIFRTSQSVL